MTITEQVEACATGAHPRRIARMASGWAVMGESQALRGYCLLLADPVVPSLNDLPERDRSAFLRDMGTLGDAVLACCSPAPRRINYEMLGNVDPTLHAHVLPRYDDEADDVRLKPVWLYSPRVWNDPASAFSQERHGALRDAIAARLAKAARENAADLHPDWQDAAAFAARAHEGHLRKDGVTPYVSHPFRVAMTVRDLFGCEDAPCIAAALLHDTIEDTRTDFDEIEEAFGEEVARTVAALTKDARLPEKERERAFDEAVERAGWRAMMVKLADVYDNLVDAGDKKRGRKFAEKARRAIAAARRAAPGRADLQRAAATVERLVRERAD